MNTYAQNKSIIEINGCLAGKILRVDLGERRVWTQCTAPYACRTLGGRGVHSLIMLEEIPPGTAWNDPENLLCMGPGSLVGTMAPAACRVDISSINVFTGGKGSANVGGFWGAELKYAGYDHLIISGKADSPVYLLIEDDRVQIIDAAHLWGKDTDQTEDLLRRELGDEHFKFALIGPAGENLIRGSAIIIDSARAAGGSGVGCVMGDKKLKAVAVRGRGALEVADRAGFMAAVDRCYAQVEANRNIVMSMRQSLTERMTDMNFEGWNSIMVVRNGQDDFWPLERRQRLMNRKDGVPTMRRGVRACPTCPAGCSAYMEIPYGPWEGMKGEGFWINTVMSASRFDLAQPDAVVAFWLRCNQLGLDTDYVASSLAWLIECYDRGIIGPDQTDGLELKFADGRVLLSLIEMLVERRGIGGLVADGAREAARTLGPEAEYLLIHVKGQPSIEPFRIPLGWGIGVATSPVAGRHLRGTTRGPVHSGPPGLDFNIADIRNQARANYWQSRTKELEDNLGICVYVGTWSGAHSLTPANFTELVNTGMGLSLSESDLMNRYARVGRYLEKAFNDLFTELGPEDDLPPERFQKEAVKSGPYAGHLARREDYVSMRDELYKLWDLDPLTGFLRRSVLMKLGLEDLVQMLEKVNKLAE
jgi:aldehyde:ferredoxin oxidoreductase